MLFITSQNAIEKCKQAKKKVKKYRFDLNFSSIFNAFHRGLTLQRKIDRASSHTKCTCTFFLMHSLIRASSHTKCKCGASSHTKCTCRASSHNKCTCRASSHTTCTCTFFLMHCLIDRCQIVTDTCKNNVSRFVWKPNKSPSSSCKYKCFSGAFLFNLH